MIKHTKIVATISDRRCDVEFIRSLYKAGMNVVRLNTAHMDEEGLNRDSDRHERSGNTYHKNIGPD